jgi:hypothetical protein
MNKGQSFNYLLVILVVFCASFFHTVNIAQAETYKGSILISAPDGGNCYLVGVWDTETKTCTLNKDVQGQVRISSSGVTLDGNGFKIFRDLLTSPSSDRVGITVSGSSNVVLKNISIISFHNGILYQGTSNGLVIQDSSIQYAGSGAIYFLNGAGGGTIKNTKVENAYWGVKITTSGNTIENSTFISTTNGIILSGSNNNVIGNYIYAPTKFGSNSSTRGIDISYSPNSIVKENTVEGMRSHGIYAGGEGVKIVNNNFINNGDSQFSVHDKYNTYNEPLPVGGNYWDFYDEEVEGCVDSNNDRICDSLLYFNIYDPDHIGPLYGDFYPWTQKDGWKASQIPDEYFAKIINSPNGVNKVYESDDSNSEVIKTLPNDWVVKVFSESVTPTGWVKIEDMTDNTIGWIFGGLEIVQYKPDKQVEFENISSLKIETKSERANKIIDIVNHYYNNIDTTKTLYSSNDNPIKISLLKEKGFPVELILAIIAQESGGIYSYNNEMVSFDYGHGIMQITFKAWSTEPLYDSDPEKFKPDTYYNNDWDNRGTFSKFFISLCKSFDSTLLTNKGLKDYRDCYFDSSQRNTNKKSYIYYKNNPANYTFKQYVNTSQSIYANIKDGLGVLSQKFKKKCPKSDIQISGMIFTCNDIEKILMVWGYNGFGFDKEINQYTGKYLLDVAQRLENLSNHFSGINYPNDDQLIQKMKIANNNKKVIKAFSPVNIHIYNSIGERLGVFEEDVVEEIPNSTYNSDHESAVVFFPEDDLTYKIVGYEDGEYGLLIDSVEDGEQVTFQATGLPIKPNETHTYTLDHQALSQGENGVVVKIDNEGDGVVDRVLNVGALLNDITPPEIFVDNISDEYILNDSLSPIVSISDESEPVNISKFLNNIDVTNSQSIILTKPGLNTFKVIAVDSVGNESIKIVDFYVRYVFNGFKNPIKNGGSGIYKLGSTIPIKFHLLDTNNNIVSNAINKLTIQKITDSILGGEEYIIENLGSDQGNVFRYDEEDNQYIYNLSTKNLSRGTWVLKVLSDDGVFHAVQISLR